LFVCEIIFDYAAAAAAATATATATATAATSAGATAVQAGWPTVGQFVGRQDGLGQIKTRFKRNFKKKMRGRIGNALI